MSSTSHCWDLSISSCIMIFRCHTHQRPLMVLVHLLLSKMIRYILILNKYKNYRAMHKKYSKNNIRLVLRRLVFPMSSKTLLKWLNWARNMNRWRNKGNCFQNVFSYSIGRCLLTRFNILFSALVVNIILRTNLKRWKMLVKLQRSHITWWIDHFQSPRRVISNTFNHNTSLTQ